MMEIPNLRMDEFEEPELYHDWHSLVGIQVCELYDAGFFDNNDGSWDWPIYTEEQDKRLREKIWDYYFYREISITPPGLWKRKFVTHMRIRMPSYLMMYKIVDDAQDELLQDKGGTHETGKVDNTYKGRSIYSDFPETLLSANSDYASNGTDSEDERVIDRDITKAKQEAYTKRLEQLDTGIANVDELIIKNIEPYFSCLFTTKVNGI